VRDALRSGRTGEAAVGVVFVVGLAASAVHWTGIVAAGVLLGVVAPSVRRAFVFGLEFSLVLVAAFAGWMAWHGALAAWVGAGPLPLVTVAAALLAPVAAVGTRLLD
jgi:short subunit fatty acids transporter